MVGIGNLHQLLTSIALVGMGRLLMMVSDGQPARAHFVGKQDAALGVNGVGVHEPGERCGTSSPRCTAGRATNAASARVTWAKSCMPTRSPA